MSEVRDPARSWEKLNAFAHDQVCSASESKQPLEKALPIEKLEYRVVPPARRFRETGSKTLRCSGRMVCPPRRT